MKTLNLILTGMILTAAATIATTAQAQVNLRRGGNHDGGGQTVLMANGDVSIADRFQPAPASEDFVAAGSQPVDIFAKFPGLEAEVQKLSSLLATYYGQPIYDVKQENGLLMNLLKTRHGEFYLVSKLPEVSDCEVPRDNSAVPANAEVGHAACTRNNVTLLLDAGPSAFSQLPLKVKADLLAHEAFRRRQETMATGTIEIIMAGLTQARDLLDRQAAGDRSLLTDGEMNTLNAMFEEFSRTNLNGWGDRMRISRAGGGLISPDSALGEGAFLGIGSVVDSGFLIGSKTQILNSQIRTHDTRGFLHGIGANSVIVDSYISGTLVSINPMARIERSRILTDKFDLNWEVTIKDSSIEGGGYAIRGKTKILNSEISFWHSDYDVTDVEIGREFLMSNSSLILDNGPHRMVDKNDPPTTTLGEGGKILNSKIWYSESYVQGANATIENLTLRVRPLKGERDPKQAFTAVSVAADSDIQGAGKPVVLLTEYSLFYNSTLKLGGSLKLGGPGLKCPMGLMPVQDPDAVEYGVKFTRLDLNSDDQLTDCAMSAAMRKMTCSPIDCDGVDFGPLPKAQ